MTSETYDFKSIEEKWQNYWESKRTFATADHSHLPKYYILDMFPYPSGSGLHVGHAEGYTATDIMARYKRMCKFHVLHPMGWDAFGLPAEQYAIKTGTHPQVSTAQNIENYRKQLKKLGFSYDWDREVNTSSPDFYKWTQWIFLRLFEKGLAYESLQAVNWCPALGTVLANEEVVDGLSEIGSHPVERKPIRQWVLKITAYAEALLQDLEDLDWPESTKEMQKHWIGKSEGTEIDFQVADHPQSFKVFTTRADTLFGASFCVLAPEHPLVKAITSPGQKEAVENYCTQARKKSEFDRSLANEKTGVPLGAYAINPVNGRHIPIYTADYVLASYGTGAVMAVPAHDQRDFEFAQAHDLAHIEVIESPTEHNYTEAAYTGPGKAKNSDFVNGLDSKSAAAAVTSWLSKNGCGKSAVRYRLRDWIFSRQRYWGEPFPIVHDHQGQPHALKDHELPVILPDINDYKPSPTGEPPLSKNKEWQEKRLETNIMPQWAGSCWYYLRFLSPKNADQAWDPELEQYWLPVDLYVGGAEHANLHLLYARFWHKVLYDCGYVKSKEPFKKLRHPGLILGENGEKMSKSRGNVINPDEVISQWGADSLRLYEMFLGPLEQAKPWQTQGISGVHRFLKRTWRLLITPDGNPNTAQEDSKKLLKLRHQLIDKVTRDIEELKFNTAIANMMEFVNEAYKEKQISQESAETLCLLLSPFAPHISEEIWQILGHKDSLAYAPWPQAKAELLTEDSITYSVMVKGRLRAELSVNDTVEQEEIVSLAKEKVSKHLEGQTIKREVFVKNKVVNFVI